MVKKNEIEDFDFDEDEEQEEQAAEPTPEPPNPELEELREFKTVALQAQREGEISDEFEKAGYSGKLAKLWSALNPEGLPTAESVKAFAAEYGVTPSRAVGYSPTVIGNEAHVPTAKTYTWAEMEQIAKENPARARALAEAGRVKWNNPEISGGKR
jgi:hypothetical protein